MTLYIVTRPEMNSGDAKPPLAINGIAIPYEFDTPIELPEEALALLRAADGMSVTEAPADEPEAEPVSQSPATGEDDGTASPDGGVADGGADTNTAPHPLDHDGDGNPGGSLPGKQSTRARGAAKKKAAAKVATTKE